MVIVLLPGGVTGLVEKPAVPGLPEALRVTGSVYPLTLPIVTLYDATAPTQISWLAGAEAIVKSGVPHSLNLKAPMRNCQPTELVVGTYSLTYQKVQSSTGSIFIEV